jgi:hypothetical protein
MPRAADFAVADYSAARVTGVWTRGTSNPFGGVFMKIVWMVVAIGLLLGAAPAPQRLEIAVTNEGFVPARLKVKVGKPLTLVVTRKIARTCATEIVIKDFGVDTPLPLNRPVEVKITPKKPGKIHFSCGMDMITGELEAE